MEQICDDGVELVAYSFSASVDIESGVFEFANVTNGDGTPLPTGPFPAGAVTSSDQVANVGHTYVATLTAQPAAPGAEALTAQAQVTVETCPTPAGSPSVVVSAIECASPTRPGAIVVGVNNPPQPIAGMVILSLWAGRRAVDTLVDSMQTFPPANGGVGARFEELQAGSYVLGAAFPAGQQTVFLEFLPEIVVDVPACANAGGASGGPPATPGERPSELPATR